jgi:catechol 2,3-dioxygenase-like lactoylglutathione lyase family enzyme
MKHQGELPSRPTFERRRTPKGLHDMAVEGIDHLAITVADVEATVAWYARVLEAEALYLDQWREGAIPVVLLQVGRNRLSVHEAAAPAKPHAAVPTVGSVDLCFRWSGPLTDALAHLGRQDVPIVEGPVPRPAANGERGESIYFRDPDGNLLEFLSVD